MAKVSLTDDEMIDLSIEVAWGKGRLMRPARYNKFEKCGDELVEKVNALNPDFVLDLGCGDNQYSDKIQNLMGIDLVNKRADLLCDYRYMEDFDDGCADVVMSLGSINFGDDKRIREGLESAYRLLKPGGLLIMRGNMNEHKGKMYYGWSIERIHKWTEHFNFNMEVEPCEVRRLTAEGKVHDKWPDRTGQRVRAAEEAIPGVNPYFWLNKRSNVRLYWEWSKKNV